MYSGNLPNSGYTNNLSQFVHQAFSQKYSSTFLYRPIICFKILYHRRGCEIRFSEILKVNVFQDLYVNEITCADPFR